MGKSMEFKKLTESLSVLPQIEVSDLAAIRAAGYRTIVCNRPDGEGAGQPTFAEIEAAAREQGIAAHYLPVESGKLSDNDFAKFGEIMRKVEKPVLAYCRTGTRAATLWALSEASSRPLPEIVSAARAAGYDLSAITRRIANGGKVPVQIETASHDIVIVGAGAAGLATAASLLARDENLDIAIIDPAGTHYYQPGWTMVGGGVFKAETTAREMAAIMPRKVNWIKAGVAAFEPDNNAVILEGCRVVQYRKLIVCPGLKLDWGAIAGLSETLGRNGVTSNYRYDLAPYTWQLVREMKRGRAIFTQPPMPIKCAGAPQKAMYLSSDYWQRSGRLQDIQVEMFNAGAVLFGVADYVPALMEHVEQYGIGLNFGYNLASIDGASKLATFRRVQQDGTFELVTHDFDMIHVVPPQKAPDFIRVSPLADQAGWVDVDQSTLRHKTFADIFALGDVINAPNAKTAAAARKQAPVVAHNVLASLGKARGQAAYDGYGSCPLTVARGKIVLAEFLYGGKVAPSFPTWLIDGKRPSRLAWLLKERVLPPLYWHAMLKGREWMAKPEIVG
jgi:sulfide:quinone oxidoreductase